MPTTENTPNFSEYKYNCEDDSIILPYFKRYWVEPLHGLIPGSITANAITLASAGLMWLNMLAVWLLIGSNWLGALAFISAACLHLYVVGDHLDGMRAKATGTGTPLGEFLDHYSDIFNLSLSLLISAWLFSIGHGLLFMLAVFSNLASFIVVLAEQKTLGLLRFGKVSTLEMVMVLTLVYPMLAWEGFAEFWVGDVLGPFRMNDLLVIAAIALPLFPFADSIKRMGSLPRELWLFLSLLLLLALLGASGMARMTAWLTLTFYSAEFGGRLLLAHVGRMPFPAPSSVNLAAVIIYALLRFMPGLEEHQELFSWILAGIIILNALLSLYHCMIPLKQFWLWRNPPRS